MLDSMSPSGSLGVRREGPIHPGFGRRGSDVGVMMGTVDICGLAWLHVSCELGPSCKVKSDRFRRLFRLREPWSLCHIVVKV